MLSSEYQFKGVKMLYRILTENKSKRDVLAITSGYFDGFTVLEGQGYWKGKAEASLILEVETTDLVSIKRLANDIKLLNEQEAILIECVSNSQFII